MSAAAPLLDNVLESFLLDFGAEGVLEHYLVAYPQFALELIDLAHEAPRETADLADPIAPAERAAIDAAVAKIGQHWPAEAAGRHDLFAALRPADYGRLSEALDVPRQVIAAVRNRRAIPDTIPGGFMRRMASALGGSVDDLLFSMGVSPALQPSFKAVDRPQALEPVAFEQILIEARVSEERRREILAERD